jgi:hypothetical protein
MCVYVCVQLYVCIVCRVYIECLNEYNAILISKYVESCGTGRF